jgi:phosphatidylserine decarboxylase
MTIHREGFKTIALAATVWLFLNIVSFYILGTDYSWLAMIFLVLTTLLFFFIVSFFRVPKRKLKVAPDSIISPADGKIVVVEEVSDEEYFHEKRLQVSIFMSPANVHLNRYPVGGEVVYSTYHPGKYLVAWHPKSSIENERHSVVLKCNSREVLIKQIAGAVARRICNYAAVGDEVKQGNELGFIKFGSRVDVLLPLDAQIKVSIGDTVKGGMTVLADW